MTETVRYTKIYAEDIAFGTGTQNIELQGGEVVALSELNISYFHDGNDNVLYASSDGTTDDTFNFDAVNNRLFIPEIAGGSASGDDVRIKGTTHATAGFVTLNEDGGNVGIGIATPTSLLHLQGTSPEILVDESSTGDPKVAFALSSVDTFVMGIDNSDSDKFKIENGGTLGSNNDFVLTAAGLIGLGTATPEASLHVFVSNSSVAPETDADDIFVETSGDTGITIGSGATSDGRVRFSRTGSATAGYLQYDHNEDWMIIGAGAAAVATFTDLGALLLGTQTESAAMADAGIVIDYNGTVGVLRATGSVAHGITALAETAAYAQFGILGVSAGGLELEGFTENEIGIRLAARITNEDTANADTADAAIVLNGGTKSGTTITAMGDTANVVSVDNAGTAVVLFKGDGDVYNSGGSTAMVTYDDYDDTKLLKAFKGVMDVNYRAKLGEWVDEHTAILERGGIITRCESGRWFISQRGWRGLLCDAIGQLDARLRALECSGAE